MNIGLAGCCDHSQLLSMDSAPWIELDKFSGPLLLRNCCVVAYCLYRLLQKYVCLLISIFETRDGQIHGYRVLWHDSEEGMGKLEMDLTHAARC
jgi:hypothetical protein